MVFAATLRILGDLKVGRLRLTNYYLRKFVKKWSIQKRKFFLRLLTIKP